MLSIIVAVAENNVIGGDNKLLWHIPEDLKRFKAITSGNTIIMGRKTFESLPGVLPNRKHLVITRDENYSVDNANVEVIHSVDKIFLTKVYKSFHGDTTFPQIDFNEFNIEFKSEIYTCEKSGLKYQFIDLIRK